MIIDHRWSDHNWIECVGRLLPGRKSVHHSCGQSPSDPKTSFTRYRFSKVFQPNPDWGIAWGTGRTNNPSLYNVKYRASHILYPKDTTAEPFSSHVSAKPNQGSEHHSLDKADGGARRDRTDDLLNANQALSQLSYGP